MNDRLAMEEDKKYRVTSYEFGRPNNIITLSYHPTLEDANTAYMNRVEDEAFNSLLNVQLTIQLSEAYDGEYLPIRIDTYVKD